jgi:hypothetical protein
MPTQEDHVMRRRTLAVCAVVGLCAVGASTGLASPPATYTVTNTHDSGAGSLRAALTYADAHTQTRTTFAKTARGTITLAGALPTLTSSVTIAGPGATALTISGANAFQVFVLGSASHVAISGLKVIHGFTPVVGGAIENSGVLTLSQVIVSGSNAGAGGAIANQTGGTIAATNSTFTDNNALLGSGCAIENASAAIGVTITLTGSVVSGNTAPEDSGGGLTNAGPDTMRVVRSQVLNNSGVYGGGVENASDGMIELTGSTVSGNTGSNGGGVENDASGKLTVSESTFSDNSSTEDGGRSPIAAPLRSRSPGRCSRTIAASSVVRSTVMTF